MVGVTIPVLNQWKYTASLLAQLAAQTVESVICLVDDGSTDETPKRLAELRTSVRLSVITHPQTMGVPRSWNDGILCLHDQHIPIIAVLNNDIDLPPWALERFEHYLTVNRRLGVIGPSYTSGPVRPPYWEDMTQGWKNHQVLTHTPHPPGFCFAFRVTDLEEIQPPIKGMYVEEEFGPFWYEDTDLFYRMERLGQMNAVCGDVLIHHYESVTLKSLPGWEAQTHEARRAYERKWKP